MYKFTSFLLNQPHQTIKITKLIKPIYLSNLSLLLTLLPYCNTTRGELDKNFHKLQWIEFRTWQCYLFVVKTFILHSKCLIFKTFWVFTLLSLYFKTSPHLDVQSITISLIIAISRGFPQYCYANIISTILYFVIHKVLNIRNESSQSLREGV